MADLFGTPNNDNFVGTPDNDRIFGGSGQSNEINTGDDLLNGLGGEDTIRGGDGNDVIFGGDDDDQLFGEIGNDALDGGAGNDTVNGGSDASSGFSILEVNSFTSISDNVELPKVLIRLETISETEIEVTVEVDESNGGLQADLRGVFFNVSNNALLESLTFSGDDITASDVNSRGLRSVGGRDNRINPERFEAGVEIGSSGIGEDDIDSTTFTISSDDPAFGLDLFSEQNFGLRLTSVGEGDSREGSRKMIGTSEFVADPNLQDDDVILGQSGDDTLNGGAGNDDIDGGGGNDTIDGGSGVDRAGYLGTFSAIEERGASFVVLDAEGNDAYEIQVGNTAQDPITIIDVLTTDTNVDSGTDTLTNIEFIVFGGEGGANTGTITVADLFGDDGINQTPVISTNEELTINEGQTSRIFNTILSVTDDDPASSITYALNTIPQQGILFLDTNPNGSAPGQFNAVFNEGDTQLQPNSTFTQSQIDQGLLAFQAPANLPETTSFVFRLTVSDDGGESVSQTFSIEVNAVNDPPELQLGTLQAAEGEIAPINEEILDVSDPDTNPENLIFEVTAPPAQGDLELFISEENSILLSELEEGETFTFSQLDLINADLRYIHNGDEPDETNNPNDSFSFTLSDGESSIDGTLEIDVFPVNDPPQLVTLTDLTNVGVEPVVLTSGNLALEDPDNTVEELEYSLDIAPGQGTLFQVGEEVDINSEAAVREQGTPLGEGSSFTQAQINNEELVYVRDAVSPFVTSDFIKFSFSDGAFSSPERGNRLNVLFAAQDPTLEVNEGLEILSDNRAGFFVIDGNPNNTFPDDLLASDGDTTPSDLVYTASNLTGGILVVKRGTSIDTDADVLQANEEDELTFTQQDLIDGFVLYSGRTELLSPSNVTSSDGVSFDFALSDGTPDDTPDLEDTFNITFV